MRAALGLLLGCALLLAFPAFADVRIALVVGVAKPKQAPALPTTGADAADVAAALSDLGFTTALSVDPDKRQLEQALQQFARDAKTADAAIVYYAGLGLQLAGRNYLAPADAQAVEAGALIAVDAVKAALNGAKGPKILILDACRENPFPTRPGDAPATPGLARDEAAADMIIAYAAKAGQTVREAEGRNSPFTAALLNALKAPGLEVGALFRRIGSEVAAATAGAQTPEIAMSATPEYYLNASETDETVWSRIRNGRDVTALEDFIARFPKSALAPDAIARIELIESRKRIASDPAPVAPPEDPAAKPQAAPAAPSAELTPSIHDPSRRLASFASAPAHSAPRASARLRKTQRVTHAPPPRARCYLFGEPERCATLAKWLEQTHAPGWAPASLTPSYPATGTGR